MVDAGLRFGEDENDWRREIEVARSYSRGEVLKSTKSNKVRHVPMSRRLRRALLQLHSQRVVENPASAQPEAYVVGRIHPTNWRKREWRWILEHAGLPANSHTPKCLRDTFASQSLQRGVPLEWIKDALGHSSLAVTETHYAQFIRGQRRHAYRELDEGAVFPDHLAAMVESPHAPAGPTRERVSEGARNVAEWLRTGVVTRARFERATPSFGGWCSIQLSYRATG